MITGNAQISRIRRRPETDERSRDIRESEFGLNGGSVHQPKPLFSLANGMGVHGVEMSIDPDRIKHILRIAQPVELRQQAFEIGTGLKVDERVRRKTGYNSKWSQNVVADLLLPTHRTALGTPDRQR